MASDQSFEVTEPIPVPLIYATRIELVIREGIMGLIAFADLASVSESRIEARIAISPETAQRLYIDLWRALRHMKRKPQLPKS